MNGRISSSVENEKQTCTASIQRHIQLHEMVKLRECTITNSNWLSSATILVGRPVNDVEKANGLKMVCSSFPSFPMNRCCTVHCTNRWTKKHDTFSKLIFYLQLPTLFTQVLVCLLFFGVFSQYKIKFIFFLFHNFF